MPIALALGLPSRSAVLKQVSVLTVVGIGFWTTSNGTTGRLFTSLKAESPGKFSISARDSPVVVKESRRAFHTHSNKGSDKFASDPTNESQKQQAPPPQTKVVAEEDEQKLEDKVNSL
jgi:hypothetical protein